VSKGSVKFALLTVSDKLRICDVSTKLNRIPYTPLSIGRNKAAVGGWPTWWWRQDRGGKNLKISLVNGAFQ